MALHELPTSLRDEVADIGILSQLSVIGEDLFASTQDLMILNMNATTVQTAKYVNIDDYGIEKIDISPATSSIGTGADCQSKVRAVAFDGSTSLVVDHNVDFDGNDLNVNINVYRADWAVNPASGDEVLLSILDGSSNGIIIKLLHDAGFTAGDPVMLQVYKSVATVETLVLEDDVKALSGYVNVGVKYEMGAGAAQALYIDGTSVDTGSETDTLIAKAADVRKTITGITTAASAVVTAASHGLSNGDKVYIRNVRGMRGINGKLFTVSDVSTHTFKIGWDSRKAYAYGSGGVVEKANPLVVTVEAGEGFTGRIDGIVVQAGDAWDAGMHELLANAKETKIILQDRDGSLKSIDTSSL